jgi:hypothetical protein
MQIAARAQAIGLLAGYMQAISVISCRPVYRGGFECTLHGVCTSSDGWRTAANAGIQQGLIIQLYRSGSKQDGQSACAVAAQQSAWGELRMWCLV